eukprot:2410884-Pyramimonas_sp.AAC.1
MCTEQESDAWRRAWLQWPRAAGRRHAKTVQRRRGEAPHGRSPHRIRGWASAEGPTGFPTAADVAE